LQNTADVGIIMPMNLARPLEVVTPTVDADVLRVLAGADASFTGRQVHQVAGRHSERGVRNALHRLVEQGVVSRERVGAADKYALNREHLAAPHIEALANLRSELIARVRAELEAWHPAAEYVAVFGSAARGDMRPDSDIDLLVVRPTQVALDDDRWRAQVDALTRQVTAWTGNDTRALELAADEIRRRSNAAIVREVARDGITLHGPESYLRRGPAHG
jgi:predicted nucleotidyltransferase